MRLRFLALPATLLLAGTALAQQGPNAVGLWRSDSLNVIAANFGFPVGAPGGATWNCLPANVLTYFRANGGSRGLDFVGFEAGFADFNGTNSTPVVQLRKAVQAAAPNQGLLVPGPTALATFPAQVLGIPAGSFTHVSYTTAPVAVTLAAGEGLCFYCDNYQQTAGANSAYVINTNGFETGPLLSNSGITCTAGLFGFPLGTTLWYHQFNIGVVPFNAHEMIVTYLFNQSMIQTVSNSTLSTAGGTIVGGGINPIPFAFYFDDGRGSINTQAGSALSYNGNSQFNATGLTGNVNFVPFVLFEGDIIAGDPAPEDWVAQAGAPELSYIHAMSLQKWIDDVIVAFGGTPGAGAVLDPANHTLALYLGIDLPFFLNVTALLNAFNFGAPIGGPFANAETPALNQFAGAPFNTASFGRNLVNLGGFVENRTWNIGQSGFTAFGSAGVGNLLGFGVNPGGAGVSGKSFSIQCWMLDNASPIGFPFKIVDVTNVAKTTLN